MRTTLRDSSEGGPQVTVAKQRLIGFRANHARWWMSFALFFTDIVSVLMAFAISFWLRLLVFSAVASWLEIKVPDLQYINIEQYRIWFAMPLLIVALFASRGLYPGNGMGPVEEMRRVIVNTGFVFLGFAAITFIEQTQLQFSRVIIAMSWILATLFLLLGRWIVRAVATRVGIWGEPVVIIGDLTTAAFLTNHLQRNPKVGLVPVVIFDDDDEQPIKDRIHDVQVFPAKKVAEWSADNYIEAALVTQHGDIPNLQQLTDYQSLFHRVTIINTQWVQQLLWISVQDLGGLMGYEIKQNLNDDWSRFIKRTIDIVGAGVGLILITPLILVLSFLIWLDDTGPVFYRQVRLGKDGNRFSFIKFRTMRVGSDEILSKYFAEDPKLKEEWDCYQKLKKDPRITRIGRVLRRFSFDELPQLINVLKGDMSLVGPRPFFPAQQADYGASFLMYSRVRPGMTGMWQVSGRNHTTFAERAQWDEYYVRNWSLWLDLFILLRTGWVVLTSEGSY